MKCHRKAFLSILGGFIVHLTIGTLYTWGNLNPYVTSYIRRHSSPSALRYGDTVWVFALACMGQGLSMFLGGILEQKVGSRLATLIGGLTMSLGVFLSSFTVKVSYYLFLLTYSFMFGIGVGLTYAPPLAVAMKWFPNHKGIVNGIIVAGFGGGAFIFDQVQTAFINPLNAKAVNATLMNTTQDIGNDKYFIDEDVLKRVPLVFILLASCYATMQIVGVALLFSPPPEVQTRNAERRGLIDGRDDNSDDESSAPDKDGGSYLPTQMIKTRPFITLWCMFMMNAMVVIFISTLYKTYGESEVINDDKLLAQLGAVAAIFNAAGRVIWGLFADKVSFKAAMVTLCAAMTILMSSLYITHVLASTAGPALLFIWVCLIFFSFSGNFSLFPTAIAKTFGPKYVSINYGLLFTSSAVAGPVGALLSTLLLQKLHSYGLFILSGCLSLVSMALGLSFNGKKADGRTV